MQSVEELILTDDSGKSVNEKGSFKKPGTNSALRKASTAGVPGEGPPGGPPNVKRLSCVDEEPVQRRSTPGGASCFSCFRSNKSNSVVELNT